VVRQQVFLTSNIDTLVAIGASFSSLAAIGASPLSKENIEVILDGLSEE